MELPMTKARHAPTCCAHLDFIIWPSLETCPKKPHVYRTHSIKLKSCDESNRLTSIAPLTLCERLLGHVRYTPSAIFLQRLLAAAIIHIKL